MRFRTVGNIFIHKYGKKLFQDMLEVEYEKSSGEVLILRWVYRKTSEPVQCIKLDCNILFTFRSMPGHNNFFFKKFFNFFQHFLNNF
jgi:hypothetical protein